MMVPAMILAAEDAEGLAANVLAWHEAHELVDGDVAVSPIDGLTLAAPDAAARIAASAEIAFPGRPYGLVLDHWDLLRAATSTTPTPSNQPWRRSAPSSHIAVSTRSCWLTRHGTHRIA